MIDAETRVRRRLARLFTGFGVLLAAMVGFSVWQAGAYERAVAKTAAEQAAAETASEELRQRLMYRGNRHRVNLERKFMEFQNSGVAQLGRMLDKQANYVHRDPVTGGEVVVTVDNRGRIGFILANVPNLPVIPPPLYEVSNDVRKRITKLAGYVWWLTFALMLALRKRPRKQAASLALVAIAMTLAAAQVRHPLGEFLWRDHTAFAALYFVPSCVIAWWLFQRRTERDPTICAVCGYDLRATPARCPECGTVPARAAPST